MNDELVAVIREERDKLRETVEALRDGLTQSIHAIDRFGFDADEYGGPHLSECIRRLGEERNELRRIAADVVRKWGDAYDDDELAQEIGSEIDKLRKLLPGACKG